MSTLSVSNITNLSNLSLSTLTAATINAETILQNGLPIGPPVGTVIERYWKLGDPIPTGYIRQDGNVYSRAAYSELASIIGTPIEIGNFTTTFSNNSLLLSDVHNANGVLFHNGTTRANNANTTTPNTIIYSRDAGTTWISAAAQGLSIATNYTNRNTHGGELSTVSTVAASGNGIYVITNRQANGVNHNLAVGPGGYGNAFVMVATSENLNSWSKIVFSGTQGADLAGGYKGNFTGGGSKIQAVAYGGTQNRFVGLFEGGYGADNGAGGGICCASASAGFSRFAWSNNGTTWVLQGSGVGNTASIAGISNFGSNDAWYWHDIVGSANGFIAIREFRNTHNPNANVVFTSSDGIVWSDITRNISNLGYMSANSTNTALIHTITPSFANGLFILIMRNQAGLSPPNRNIGSSEYILVSNNRTDWTAINVTSSYSVTVNNSIISASPFFTNNLAGGVTRKIYHNGKFYYTSDGTNRIAYSTDLAEWYPLSLNIVASANVGNTIFGQAISNTGSTLERLTIRSANHNTYNETTEFPVPSDFERGLGHNPFIKGTTFIKT
jgi:hypothetical protein